MLWRSSGGIMDWFRCYSEFATDPKVQIMPEHMQRRLIMLFCLRSGNVLATLHETEIAFSLRITEQELAETKMLFLQKGFVNDNWEIQNWDKRQYVSDSSTARSKKHREKKKESMQRQCNVAATPPDTDTDTEQKEEKENIKEKNAETEIIKVFKKEFEGGFWPVFPQNGRTRGSMKKALAKYVVARAKSGFNEIMQGLQSYAKYIRDNGQKNCDAFRWLEDERWRDDYAVAQQSAGAGARGQPMSKSERAAAAAEKGLAEYQGQHGSSETIDITPVGLF